MAVQRLTAQFCLLAQCAPGKKRSDFYCNTVTGFVMEARKSGSKSYFLRFQGAHGCQKHHLIGAYGAISFAQARKEAQRLRSEVVLGGDPAAAKAERKAIPTYAELAQKHLDYAKTYQRSYSTTEMYMRRHILPKWRKKHLSEITQPDVAKWLAEKADEGLAAATILKIRILFNRSFELALRWNLSGVTKNPVKGIPHKPINNARERFLNAAEAKRLLEAVQASRNTQLPHIVGLLLLTGCRVPELLHAKWEHVDLERRLWLIPLSKTGKARRVPLSAAAIAILETVPKFDKCPYVVPNRETRKPFVSIKHGWDKARTDAKQADLRIHDLRHSAASFMINAGVDLFAVGRVLGHADHKSTMRYSHLANDTLLAAVEAGANKMQGRTPMPKL